MLSDTTYHAMLDSFAAGEFALDGWSESQIDAFFARLYSKR